MASKKVLTAEQTATIVNGIRNEQNDEYKAIVPLLAKDLSNMPQVADAINNYTPVRNAFASNLINRIGKTIITKMFWEDPFTRVFFKGNLPLGDTIQSIFVDLAKSYDYSWTDTVGQEAELLYSREVPNILTQYIEINIERTFKTTITTQELSRAFISENGLMDLVDKIASSLMTSLEVYKYEKIKELLKEGYAKNYFKTVEVDEPVDTDTAKAFAKTVRALTRKLTFPSKDYNGAGVTNSSSLEDQIIILRPEAEAELSVDVLSYAFNVEFSKLKPDEVAEKVMVMDVFDESMDDVVALVVDKDFIMIYQKLLETYTEFNGALMYYNTFMHWFAAEGLSAFHNAVALVKKN